MSSKHVFNSPDGLVVKSLRGAVALNPLLRLHATSKSVYCAERSDTARVAVISGGGAGHEPAHAGYTGRGFLSACVSGDIFASPSASQILTCIKLAIAVQQTNDVLLIINNYTGDRLNFGLAAERAKAEIPGVHIESVVVADDVSLLSKPSLVGPRGLAGNILVCKILGAAAEAGQPLEELKLLGDAVVACLASVGIGLEHCHVPGRDAVSDKLGYDECELGLGLHNEPGVRRMKAESPEALIGEMLCEVLGYDGPDFRPEDNIALYINNLGGISVLEMGAIVDTALSQLSTRGIHPVRVLCASFMTSLNAPGFSISLLNVTAIRRRLPTDVEILSLIDAPTSASAWTSIRSYWPELRSQRNEEEETEMLLSTYYDSSTPTEERRTSSFNWSDLGVSGESVEKAIRDACAAVLAVESDLTRFDTVLGDGDCGMTFSSGAKSVLNAMDSQQLDAQALDPAQLISRVAELLVNSMGGTSGAIFGLYFTALSSAFATSQSAPASFPLRALEALSSHTPARPGDRTLVDALHPFCIALDSGSSFQAATEEARKGAESTRGMIPRLGRAVYVGVDENLANKLPPDPGAWGLKAILEGLQSGLSRNK